LQFPYVKQLRDKDLALHTVLGPVIKADSSRVFQRIQPSPEPLGYRTSTKLVLSEDDFGQRRIGLFERGSKRVVDIPGCPVHHPEINRLLDRMWGPKAPPPPAPFYQHDRRGYQKERCKFVTVRHAPNPGSFAIVLSHTGIPRAALERWAVALKMPHVALYEAALGATDGDLVLPHEALHLAGPREIPFEIGGRTYHLGPLAFFQANASLTAAFVSKITSGLAGEELLDLYGGFGAYSFAVMESFRKIHLVDANPHAILAAKEYARTQNVRHVIPIVASVEDYLSGSKVALHPVTHVFVNPPRGGLSPRARQLIIQNLPNLRNFTYVSCNPETLARDLRDLTGKSKMRVDWVAPFDMFPQTPHVETVVRLVRGETAFHSP
jgi:23S rRNA (uracil1939-C5)-methyltransferase